MMKSLTTSILLVFCLINPVSAQSDQDNINRQVWFPFMKAYEQLDASLFMSLHSKDIMRVELDTEKIFSYDAYENKYKTIFSEAKKNGDSLQIRFSFTNRISDGTRALEKGFYEFTLHGTKGIYKGYGIFTVILSKKDGQWKLIVDSDSNKDISEAVFLTGKILE